MFKRERTGDLVVDPDEKDHRVKWLASVLQMVVSQNIRDFEVG